MLACAVAVDSIFVLSYLVTPSFPHEPNTGMQQKYVMHDQPLISMNQGLVTYAWSSLCWSVDEVNLQADRARLMSHS